MQHLFFAGLLLVSSVYAQEAEPPQKIYKIVFEHTLKADKYQSFVDILKEKDAVRKANDPDYVPPARWIGVWGDGLRFLAEFERETPPQNYIFWPKNATDGSQHLVRDTKVFLYVSQFDASEKPLLTGANQKKYKIVYRQTILPDGYPRLAKWFETTDQKRKESNPEYKRPRRFFQVMGNCLIVIIEGQTDSLSTDAGIWPASGNGPIEVVTKLSKEVYRSFADVD